MIAKERRKSIAVNKIQRLTSRGSTRSCKLCEGKLSNKTIILVLVCGGRRARVLEVFINNGCTRRENGAVLKAAWGLFSS